MTHVMGLSPEHHGIVAHWQCILHEFAVAQKKKGKVGRNISVALLGRNSRVAAPGGIKTFRSLGNTHQLYPDR